MGSVEPDTSRRSKELVGRVIEMIPRMQRNAAQLDRENEFPVTEIQELHSAGALAAVLPVDSGGLGMGTEANGALYLYDLLRAIGRGNLAVGRIFEGHINAIVLIALYGNEQQLAQASRDALAGHLFAVWNTEPSAGVHMVGHELRGSKIFCSAAGHASRAIITARDENGRSLMLLLALQRGEYIESMPFRTQGMRAATTKKVVFDGVRISAKALVGQPDDYTREPAFSSGAWRASAATVGGLEALIEEARIQLVRADRHRDPHQQARIGRAVIAQETARMWGRRAALIGEDTMTASEDKAAYVNLARCAIEAATVDAIKLVQRSLGLAAFVEPNPAERMIRDLGTYLRQPAPDEALTEAAAWFIEDGEGIERLKL